MTSFSFPQLEIDIKEATEVLCSKGDSHSPFCSVTGRLHALRRYRARRTQATDLKQELQPETHIEGIPKRGAEREANLDLEEGRGKIHSPGKQPVVSNFRACPVGEEGNA